jgi:hypothetical protein
MRRSDTFENSHSLTETFGTSGINSSLNPHFKWSGDGWEIFSSDDSDGSSVSGSVMAEDDSVSAVTIPVPRNTSFIILNGSVSVASLHMVEAPLNVQINQISPRAATPAWIDSPHQVAGERTRAGVPFGIGDYSNVTFFFSPLDPLLLYNITLSPVLVSNDSKVNQVVIDSITFYSSLL